MKLINDKYSRLPWPTGHGHPCMMLKLQHSIYKPPHLFGPPQMLYTLHTCLFCSQILFAYWCSRFKNNFGEASLVCEDNKGRFIEPNARLKNKSCMGKNKTPLYILVPLYKGKKIHCHWLLKYTAKRIDSKDTVRELTLHW